MASHRNWHISPISPPHPQALVNIMSLSAFIVGGLKKLFYFWLHWIFIIEHKLSLVAMSGGYSSCGMWDSHCGGFFCWEAQVLECLGSVVTAHGFCCPAACEIFPDHGSNWFPALAGGFLTTGPLGKPKKLFLRTKLSLCLSVLWKSEPMLSGETQWTKGPRTLMEG